MSRATADRVRAYMSSVRVQKSASDRSSALSQRIPLLPMSGVDLNFQSNYTSRVNVWFEQNLLSAPLCSFQPAGSLRCSEGSCVCVCGEPKLQRDLNFSLRS